LLDVKLANPISLNGKHGCLLAFASFYHLRGEFAGSWCVEMFLVLHAMASHQKVYFKSCNVRRYIKKDKDVIIEGEGIEGRPAVGS
jgi:hypothetical protein